MASPTIAPLKRSLTLSSTSPPFLTTLLLDTPTNALVRSATLYSKSYMSSPHFDSSHNFNHILSVTALALQILGAEQARREQEGLPPLNRKVVLLGALLHDIEDKKYSDMTGAADRDREEAPNVYDLMLSWKADPELASLVSRLCSGVSFTAEIQNPARVHELITKIPELAVVQDADRLDALGAVGIGRCFLYGGAKGRSMGDCIGHFVEKLFKLERMMKTEKGREMARERTRKLREFWGWWTEEIRGVGSMRG